MPTPRGAGMAYPADEETAADRAHEAAMPLSCEATSAAGKAAWDRQSTPIVFWFGCWPRAAGRRDLTSASLHGDQTMTVRVAVTMTRTLDFLSSMAASADLSVMQIKKVAWG
jgi:hypothetical protein